jgi:hypothetical protein
MQIWRTQTHITRPHPRRRSPQQITVVEDAAATGCHGF